jgi:hypothetical protein
MRGLRHEKSPGVTLPAEPLANSLNDRCVDTPRCFIAVT